MFTLRRYFQTAPMGQKFGVMGALALLLVLFLAWQGLSTTRMLRAATQNELLGVKAVEANNQLLIALQQHRNAPKPERVDSIQKQWEAVANILQPEWTQSAAAHDKNLKLWKIVSSSRDADALDHAAIDKLIQAVVLQTRLISDESELTLDPVLPTYYLMSVSNFELPTMLETLARIQRQVLDAQAAPANSAHNLSDIQNLEGGLEQLLDTVDIGLGKVQGSLPEQTTAVDALRATLQQVKAASQQITIALQNPNPEMQSLLQQAQVGQRGAIELQQGTKTLLTSLLQQRLNDYNWSIGLSLAAMLVTLTATSCLAFAMAQDLQTRVRTNLQALQRLKSGDLQAHPVAPGSDEMGQIATEIEHLRQAQVDFVQQLHNSTQAMGQAALALRSTSTAVKDDAGRQADSSSAVAASVEQMTAAIALISDSAQTTHSLANQVQTQAVQGTEGIEQVCSSMGEFKLASNNLQSLIAELGDSSAAISSIVDTIGAIANQTNLLALNAAIEAARAGEEGRGFAVVADEVRNLAEKTAASTQQISSLIGALQNKSNTAVQVVGSWDATLQTGLQRAQITLELIHHIHEQSAQAQGAVNHVKSSVSEQSAASNLIAQQVEMIARMAESNQQAMNTLDFAVGQINELSYRMQAQAAHYRT